MNRSIKITFKACSLFLLIWLNGQNALASASLARSGLKLSSKLSQKLCSNSSIKPKFSKIVYPGFLAGVQARNFYTSPLKLEKLTHSQNLNAELDKMDQHYHDIFRQSNKYLHEGNYQEAFDTYSGLIYSENFSQFKQNYAEQTHHIISQSIEDENFLFAKKSLDSLDNANPKKLHLAKTITENTGEEIAKVVGGEADYFEIMFFDFASRFINISDKSLPEETLSLQDTTRNFLSEYHALNPQEFSPNFQKFVHQFADDKVTIFRVLMVKDSKTLDSFQDFIEAHNVWKEKVSVLAQYCK